MGEGGPLHSTSRFHEKVVSDDGKGLVGAFSSWLRRRAKSFAYAGRGLALICSSQPNFQIHLVISGCAIAASWFFQFSTTEWLIVLLTISFVLTIETVNSALEKMVDLCQPDFHPLAKDAKDLCAAAVLIASSGALIVGVILFAPRILRTLAG